MRKIALLLVGFLLTFALIGCGGGGSGDGDGNQLLDDALYGVWHVVCVVESDVIQPLAGTLGWQSGWTNQTLEFKDTGEVIRRSYTGTTLSSTENGTWTARDQVAAITFGTDVSNQSYFTFWDGGQPWSANFTFAKGGHDYTSTYVKVVPLTGHNLAMARSWVLLTATSPSPVKVDNVEVSPATYFDMPAECNAFSIQLLADGTLIVRKTNGYNIVQKETGTWASGGGTFQMTIGGQMSRGFASGSGYTWTFNDIASGQTVVLQWSVWAPDDNHPAAFVGQWEAVSVTRDGNPLALATFFGWEAGVTSLIMEFWSDGTSENRKYKGSTLFESKLGYWSVSTDKLRLQSVDYREYNCSLNGSSATLSAQASGHVYDIKFNKVV
jgi:hypothetical protein